MRAYLCFCFYTLEPMCHRLHDDCTCLVPVVTTVPISLSTHDECEAYLDHERAYPDT